MNCSNCGNILQPGEKYCSVCGEKINIEQNPTGQPSAGQPSVEPATIIWTPQEREEYMNSHNPEGNADQHNPEAGANPQFGMDGASGQPGKPGNGKLIAIIAGAVAAVLLFIGASGYTAYKFLPVILQKSGSQTANAQPIDNPEDCNGNNGADPSDPDAPGENPDNTGNGNNGGGSLPAGVDPGKKGTQNRQEGNTIYVADGGIYNDMGSYNMDFYKEDRYLNSSFSRNNASMTVVDENALYYVNSALDVSVEQVGVNYGGICYNGNALYYVTDYAKGNSAALYIVDLDEHKKYKIDENVSGYNVMISPNGTRVAYTKYMDTGVVAYVSGIGMEPEKVFEGNCDIYCVSDDGQFIYGSESDDEKEYSLYCYRGAGKNKLIAGVQPQRVYANSAMDSILFRTRKDYNLYYFDASMEEASLVYANEASDIFPGAMTITCQFSFEVIDSPSLYGVAFSDFDNGTFVFNGPDKEPLLLTSRSLYIMDSCLGDDKCYYAFRDNDTIAKYCYSKSSGALEQVESYSVEGSIDDISTNIDLTRIWYCNRDGQLWLIENGEQKMLTDTATFSYSGSTYYNYFEKTLYFIQNGTLCSIDTDGKIVDTGCKCDSFAISYSNDYATAIMDADRTRYIYVAGRMIKDN